MSAECWIELGSYFGTCHFRSGDTHLAERWFLPKGSITDEIIRCIGNLPEKPQEVTITSQLAKKIIGQRGGASIALLVTEGMQEWPNIRQPIQDRSYSMHVRRPSPLLDSDFIFGVTERVDAKGEVMTPLNDDDLEFLVGKLQMSKIKQVAIGFLHSKRNPTHELKAAEKLKEAGFEVFCSHEVPEDHNEVARWWRVFLNAYVSKSFESFQEDLKEIEEELNLKVHLVDGFGEKIDQNPNKYLDTLFSHWAMKLYKVGFKPFVYFGLEEFAVVFPEKDQTPWQTEFGPIFAPRYKHQLLSVQPTQILGTDIWGLPQLKDQEIGYEPGPMTWGRSLKPTFIDLMLYCGDAIKSEKLNFDNSPSKLKTIDEVVRTYITTKSDDSVQEIIESTYELSTKKIAQDLVQLELIGELPAFGPLAPAMVNRIGEDLDKAGIKLREVVIEPS